MQSNFISKVVASQTSSQQSSTIRSYQLSSASLLLSHQIDQYFCIVSFGVQHPSPHIECQKCPFNLQPAHHLKSTYSGIIKHQVRYEIETSQYIHGSNQKNIYVWWVWLKKTVLYLAILYGQVGFCRIFPPFFIFFWKQNQL